MALHSKWQVLGPDAVWVDFDDATNALINNELQNESRVIVYRFSPPGAGGNEYEYSLDVIHMKQINTDTGVERKVRCVSGIPAVWTYNGQALSDGDNAIINGYFAARQSTVSGLSVGQDLNIDEMMAYDILVQKLILPEPTQDTKHMCPVCYGSARLNAMLPCGHVICYNCLPRIVSGTSKCPTCRAAFERCRVINLQGSTGRFIDRSKLYWTDK